MSLNHNAKNNFLDKKVLLVLAFFIGGLQLYFYRNFQPDDAFIYLVYIKNLIQGNGLTFNGEYVEGFSSITWVYINALLSWLPFSLLMISKIIGSVSYFLLAVLSLKIMNKLLSDITNFYKFFSLLIILICPPLSIWAVGGLETTFYAFVLLLSVYIYFNYRIISKETLINKQIFVGLLFGFLGTIRPEAFALAGIVFLFECIIYIQSKKVDWSFYKNFLLGYTFFVVTVLIWRYSLYGEILPATVLAKTGDLHYQIYIGLGYLKQFTSDYWLLIIFYIISLVIGYKNQHTNIQLWNYISLIVVSGYTLFILASGGDWMLSYRFFVPILPFILLSIFINFNASKYNIPLLAFLLIFFIYSSFTIYPKIIQQLESDKGDIILGKYIKSLNLPKSEFIAVFDAGAIPYYSEHKTIDMIGLNNKHIAHQPGKFMYKYDNSYVLSFKPIYIQLRTKIINGEITPILFFEGTTKLFYSTCFQKNYIFDINSPVSHWYKRRQTPVNHTFLDTFYNFNISDTNLTKEFIKFKILKTGDGVWLKSPWGLTTGSVNMKISVENSKGEVVYQKLHLLKKDMTKGESERFHFNLPKLQKGIYKIKIHPILMNINEFENSNKNSVIKYLYIDEKKKFISELELNQYNSSKLEFYHWSTAEKTYRWSLGKSSEIKFRITNKQKFKGVSHFHIRTLGKQEIKLTINNQYIGNKTVDSSDTNITFKFDPKLLSSDAINTIKFEFPDAHKPNNGDQRVLAMALKSFSIE